MQTKGDENAAMCHALALFHASAELLESEDRAEFLLYDRIARGLFAFCSLSR